MAQIDLKNMATSADRMATERGSTERHRYNNLPCVCPSSTLQHSPQSVQDPPTDPMTLGLGPHHIR